MRQRKLRCFFFCLIILSAVFCTAAENTTPAVSPTEEDIDYSLLPDYAEASYAVLNGSTTSDELSALYPNAKLYPYDTLDDAVNGLADKKADYFIGNKSIVYNAARRNPDLIVIPGVLFDEEDGIVYPKGNSDLKNEIDKILRRYLDDGTMLRIIRHWIRSDNSDYVIEEVPQISNGPVLHAAIEAKDEPMCFLLDGKPAGLDIELINHIAYDLGMTLELDDIPFSDIFTEVAAGKYDLGISNIGITEMRKKQVDFSISYFNNPVMRLSRKDLITVQNDTSMEGLPDIKTASYAITAGGTYDTYIEEVLPDAEMMEYESLPEALYAVSQGKTDYLMDEKTNIIPFLRENKGITLLPKVYFYDYWAAAFAKGNKELSEKVADIITEFQQDGTLNEMITRWTRNPAPAKYTMPAIPEVSNGPELRIVTCSTIVPGSFIQDGQLIGMDIELGRRIAYRLGMKAVFYNVESSAVLTGVVMGKYDMGLASICRTPERELAVDFSPDYFKCPVVLAVNTKRYNQAHAENKPELSRHISLNDIGTSFKRTFIEESRWKMYLHGICTTILVSLCAGLFGTLLGILICAQKRSPYKGLRKTAQIYILIIQRMPMVILLMILYYLVFGKSSLSAVWVGIIGFILNFSAKIAEILDISIDSIDKGQLEAARASGFNQSQVFRNIIVPQTEARMLPIYKSEFISLIKETAVIGYISAEDLTKVGDIIRARTYEAFFPLITSAVIYFLLTYILTNFLDILQKQIKISRLNRKLKGVSVQ